MIKIQVQVKPNSKKQEVISQENGSYLVYLKSPANQGKANQELIALIAQQFGVPKSRVSIRLGLTSRQKLLEIDN